MERLKEIIGPAPSEIPLEELEVKLREIRRNVTEDLQDFLTPPKKKKTTRSAKTAKVTLNKNLAKALEGLNITAEELSEMIREQQMEEKGEKT